MRNPSAKIKLDEFQSDLAVIRGLELRIGEILEEEEWGEAMGPTPMPKIETLRDWDFRLLSRYAPLYTPDCDFCCICAYGKCDLTDGKKGACGMDLTTQQARRMLIDSVVGASAHASHASHILKHAIDRCGKNHPIDMGGEIEIEAPIIRTVIGIRPKKLGDLTDVLTYAKLQLSELLSSAHPGQEKSHLDYESKALHAGMMDSILMEVSDLAQIAALNFAKGDAETKLVDIGLGVVDYTKPTILFIGHNVAAAACATDYMAEAGLGGKVELAALCCTAHDLGRYNAGAKIVGPMSKTLMYLRSGEADVVVLDQECVRLDSVEEAKRSGARVIATSNQIIGNLPDRTNSPAEETIEELVSGKEEAVAILDPFKAGKVAVEVAMKVAPKRPDKVHPREVLASASACVNCGLCRRACPADLKVDNATHLAGKGDLKLLGEVYRRCIGCGRCEPVCPKDLAIVSIIRAAAFELFEHKHKIRAGRGPIKDTEIRNVGRPIVMGEIPGVVAFVGCSNYPRGFEEVGKLIDEFAKRKYIITVSGCAAQDAASYRDEKGQNLYEKYPGDFDAGGLVNVGSCVSNAHIIGAAIKIANIFAKKPLRANYEEIADYILNRVGAVGVVFGTYANKAQSIANGCIRLGIPVILGPHGLKHRRSLVGNPDKQETWEPYDASSGEKIYVGPAPKDMWYVAETMEEIAVCISKLVMRPSDTNKGRQIKLTNYVDIHEKYYGTFPDDLHLFIRTESDIPLLQKDRIVPLLKERGWSPTVVPAVGTTLYEKFVIRRK